MFKSYTVRNFRCFRELTLEPLDRVNLISGMNNVGKTALLESVFLLLGPNLAELAVRVNAFRGVGPTQDAWRWLFYDRRQQKTIELTSSSDEKNQTLRIYLNESGGAQSIANKDDDQSEQKTLGSLTTTVGPSELILEYEDSTGLTGTSRGMVSGDEIKFELAKLGQYPVGVFIRPEVRTPKENVERFSKLEIAGRQVEILDTLRVIEPRLRRITVLVTDGNANLFGDIGAERPDRLMPLGLMGQGLGKLLSILLAILDAKGGTVLVDEIENGFHYSVLKEVWKAIAATARRNDVQVFATTHSWECIKAAHEAFSKDTQYDLRLFRLERHGDRIKSVVFDQETLETSVRLNLEVR